MATPPLIGEAILRITANGSTFQPIRSVSIDVPRTARHPGTVALLTGKQILQDRGAWRGQFGAKLTLTRIKA